MTSNRYSQLVNRSGKGVEKLLGELELDVMRVVWERGQVTVREVLNALTTKRPLAYTTILTIMSRLAEKRLLLTDKEGKTYHYYAAFTEKELAAQAVGRMVQLLLTDFGGEVAISQFVEQLSAVSPEQLTRLAELARQAQEEQDEA